MKCVSYSISLCSVSRVTLVKHHFTLHNGNTLPPILQSVTPEYLTELEALCSLPSGAVGKINVKRTECNKAWHHRDSYLELCTLASRSGHLYLSKKVSALPLYGLQNSVQYKGHKSVCEI